MSRNSPGFLYFADLREVVLVGHSYGGLVIAGAAARAAARISRLVYLDAFIADDGQSMFDLLRPERRKVYEESTVDGLIASPPPEVFGVRRPRRLARRPPDRPAAARPGSEPLSLPVRAAAAAPVRPLHPGPADARASPASRRACATPRAGTSSTSTRGHDAMIIRPHDLAALLAT